MKILIGIRNCLGNVSSLKKRIFQVSDTTKVISDNKHCQKEEIKPLLLVYTTKEFPRIKYIWTTEVHCSPRQVCQHINFRNEWCFYKKLNALSRCCYSCGVLNLDKNSPEAEYWHIIWAPSYTLFCYALYTLMTSCRAQNNRGSRN